MWAYFSHWLHRRFFSDDKRTNTGIWHSYAPPQLSGASELSGTVVEVFSGDTLYVLPSGVAYDDESKIKKISLASIRAPRVGNERAGRPDEPYCHECKDRLRVLTVGKPVKVSIHYERDIPMGEVCLCELNLVLHYV
jgi:staphylococcal nuclease domain-containing protein 1